MPFPKNVRALHQIEITSRCNLACAYCPNPQMASGKAPWRPTLDMSEQDFSRALQWVEHFVKRGTQFELNLAGVGESTMHHKFVDFVREARSAVGPDIKLILATNGLIRNEDMIAALQPYNLRVFVSLHRPEKAGLAVDLYKKYGLFDGISMDPSINANDWAGQVKWKNDAPGTIRCSWLNVGKLFALADGRLSRCCLDATGEGVLGHVNDEIGSLKTSPYPGEQDGMCGSCGQVIDVPGYQQYKTGKFVAKLPVVP